MRWNANQGKKLIRAIFLGKQFIGYSLLAGKGNKISINQQWAEIIISQQCENILTLELFPAFLLIRWNCQMLSLFYFILFYNCRGETFFRTMVSWTDFKRTVARIADERWPRGRVRWKHKPINEKSHDACWLVLTVFYTNVRLKWWWLANGCLFNHRQATIIHARVSSMPFHLTCTQYQTYTLQTTQPQRLIRSGTSCGQNGWTLSTPFPSGNIVMWQKEKFANIWREGKAANVSDRVASYNTRFTKDIP